MKDFGMRPPIRSCREAEARLLTPGMVSAPPSDSILQKVDLKEKEEREGEEKAEEEDEDSSSDSLSDAEKREGSSGFCTARRVGMGLALAALLALASGALLQGHRSPQLRRGIGGPVMSKVSTDSPEYYAAMDEPVCSAEDFQFLESLASQGSQAFFEKAGTCGRNTVSLGWGLYWHAEKWIPCVRDAYAGISERCLTCYSGNGEYGLQHCAAQCLVSWCSEGCISCGNAYKETLSTCVGRSEQELPWPKKCCLSHFGQWTPDAC